MSAFTPTRQVRRGKPAPEPVMRFATLLGSALASMVTACGFVPEDGEPFDPPPVFDQWWLATEQCAGQQHDPTGVSWFTVTGAAFSCPSESSLCAGWWTPDRQIYIADEWLEVEWLIRHEMMHDITGGGGHPSPPFDTPCDPELILPEDWRDAIAGDRLDDSH